MSQFWAHWNLLEQEYCYPYGRIECPLTWAKRPEPGCSLLLKSALLRGDVAGVQRAMRQGAQTTFVSQDPRCPFSTPLFIAQWLHFDNDDDNNKNNDKDLSPMVNFLLGCEPRPARPAIRREFAIACGEVSISLAQVQRMVEYFGQDIVQEPPGEVLSHFTPLHYACYQGNWPLIQYLTQHGADWHASSSSQNHNLRLTPLHVLRYNPVRPNDMVRCMAWWIFCQSHHGGKDWMLWTDASGTTVLESIVSHGDQETCNLIITCLAEKLQHRPRTQPQQQH